MSEREIFCYVLMALGAVYVCLLPVALYLSVKRGLPIFGMPAPKNEPPYHAPPRYRR